MKDIKHYALIDAIGTWEYWDNIVSFMKDDSIKAYSLDKSITIYCSKQRPPSDFVIGIDWGIGESISTGEPGILNFPIQSTGPCICKKCNMINEYAEPNQKDGSYICYECK